MTVTCATSFAVISPELIHSSTSDFIHACLVNTDHGIPFITTLELRLLDIIMYRGQLQSLAGYNRLNFGSVELLRYNYDKYDRMWYPSPADVGYKALLRSDAVVLKPSTEEQVPLMVMSTVVTPINSTDPISYWWTAKAYDEFILYVHLAEVELLEINQKREFHIFVNGIRIATVSPSTTITTVKSGILSGSPSYQIILSRTNSSTHPPILNAIEIYYLRKLLQTQTDDQDAAAIWSTKSSYRLQKLKWQGDPCVPDAWVGLNCSYAEATKIISLNLSSRGLSGDITTALANLTMIESLDLSYNNLTGNVPNFLAGLNNLRTLNLLGNNFTRPLPAELVAKSNKGLLQLSIEGIKEGVVTAEDTISCPNRPCKRKKHKMPHVVLILASIILCILILAIIVCKVQRQRKRALIRRNELFLPKKEQFTYSELQTITNNFRHQIGQGASGTVYRGTYEDKQVAVKMLSDQGNNNFQAEVKLLMKIHHINITTLIGYCNDNNHKGLIYEFMAKGSLEEHLFDLSDGSPKTVSWEQRIRIGCNVAEGLAYMHHSCRPPIVHRDIKPSNILLSGSFLAKLADFGLSKALPTEGVSLVSTKNVVGTMGYIDPQFLSSNKWTKKSDVYSFGVTLLVLITSREAISNNIHITKWVKSVNGEGNVNNIIGLGLDGNFDTNVASRVVKIALNCVSDELNNRPTMNDVARDLKQFM